MKRKKKRGETLGKSERKKKRGKANTRQGGKEKRKRGRQTQDKGDKKKEKGEGKHKTRGGGEKEEQKGPLAAAGHLPEGQLPQGPAGVKNPKLERGPLQGLAETPEFLTP